MGAPKWQESTVYKTLALSKNKSYALLWAKNKCVSAVSPISEIIHCTHERHDTVNG